MLVKEIDTSACTKCGACSRICANSRVISPGDDGYPRFEREVLCIQCGHCLAICPSGAISFKLEGDDACGDYIADARDFGAGSSGPEYLLRALDSARSCRSFDGGSVERGKLERILESMVRSPSAGNEQNRNFYVLDSKGKVDELEADTAAHYRRTNSTLSSPFAARLVVAFIAGRDYSRTWFRNRTLPDMPKARRKETAAVLLDSMTEKSASGGARYFFDSSAAFVVTSRTNTGGFHRQFYKADVEIAITYGVLAASALGLASCRMGLCEIAFGRDKAMRKKYGIPPNERVDGVLALGYSGLSWKRLPPRGPVKVNWR